MAKKYWDFKMGEWFICDTVTLLMLILGFVYLACHRRSDLLSLAIIRYYDLLNLVIIEFDTCAWMIMIDISLCLDGKYSSGTSSYLKFSFLCSF